MRFPALLLVDLAYTVSALPLVNTHDFLANLGSTQHRTKQDSTSPLAAKSAYPSLRKRNILGDLNNLLSILADPAYQESAASQPTVRDPNDNGLSSATIAINDATNPTNIDPGYPQASGQSIGNGLSGQQNVDQLGAIISALAPILVPLSVALTDNDNTLANEVERNQNSVSTKGQTASSDDTATAASEASTASVAGAITSLSSDQSGGIAIVPVQAGDQKGIAIIPVTRAVSQTISQASDSTPVVSSDVSGLTDATVSASSNSTTNLPDDQSSVQATTTTSSPLLFPNGQRTVDKTDTGSANYALEATTASNDSAVRQVDVSADGLHMTTDIAAIRIS